MKKSFLIPVFLLLISTLTAYSQGGRFADISAEEIAERQTERLATRIDLKPQQRESVYIINLDFAKQMKKIRSNGFSEDTREKMRKISAERDKKLEKVLSKEQFKKYEELRAELKNRPGGNRNR